ncbi:MAG TPA: lytic transglycosylase domain-containing protein [Gaiellaceae bacterium]|nr:lytic transglycosylase domain-containing protein [Gaiellaceae bacterium]
MGGRRHGGARGRRLIRALIVAGALALAAGAYWALEGEPDWYLRARYPLAHEHVLRGHAASYGLDPALLAAVVYVESRFRADARSPAGAVGLMQLLPETARGIAVRTGGTRFVLSDLLDPELNVRYGSWYLDHLRDRYRSLRLALAAYHAGQGNVDRWRREGRGIAFAETREYVADVMRARGVYARLYARELGLRSRPRAG